MEGMKGMVAAPSRRVGMSAKPAINSVSAGTVSWLAGGSCPLTAAQAGDASCAADCLMKSASQGVQGRR